MEAVVIMIEHHPSGVVMDVRGTVVPGSDTLVEKLALVGLAAMDAEMKKLQAAGEFGEPLVAGNPDAIAKSPYFDAKRIDEPGNYWTA